MPTMRLDTDYLVLGAGAMSLAFVDVILAEDPSACLVMVDRRDSPGGHWNDAYPFVRLHQPAAFYGLNSKYLGEGGADLASGPEVVAYYKRAMSQFLATGRVQFLSMCEYQGGGRVVSVVNEDRVVEVTARRRVVDGTYMTVEVPFLRPPPYAVNPDVRVIPPNGLPHVDRPWKRFVVVGAGKTGIDAILFLLDAGVAPERIQWIVSNEAWLWNRATVQPGVVLKTMTSMVENLVDAVDIDDVFRRLEREGIVFRIDTATVPSKWRCATINEKELVALRQVGNVVRLGRVVRIGASEIQLEAGTVDAVEDSLFIDCSANGLGRFEAKPLFSEGRIILQSVFMCQQTFSAALIAHLELLDINDEKRNRVCTAAPHPEAKQDLPSSLLISSQNMINLQAHMPLWLRRSRLNPMHHSPILRYLLGATKLALLQRKAIASMNRMQPELRSRARRRPRKYARR
ncbi:MAG TPA: hypothetical protein VLR26_09755 [Frankiaceae bacterium]|nr:hypothetical protein [Frankiaceae bacterium]